MAKIANSTSRGNHDNRVRVVAAVSGRIEVGDLVMIVRGHKCCVAKAGGIPFRVTGFVEPRGGGWYCEICNTNDAWNAETAVTGFRRANCPLSWLKKIDPPAIPESAPTKEELPA